MNSTKKYSNADIETCLKGIEEGSLFAKARMAILILNQNDPSALPNAYNLMIEVAEADPVVLHLMFKSGKQRGEIGAYYGLFLIWDQAIGAQKNKALGYKYLTLAAKHRYTQAEFLLGQRLGCSHSLHGLKRDDKKAEKYLLQAAKKNLSDAHTELFHLLLEKNDVLSNEKAVQHLERSIEIRPSAYELDILSELYGKNDIVEKDIVKSAMWFYISFEFGFSTNEEMDEINALMSEKETTEARISAIDWIKTNQTSLQEIC